MDIRIINLDGTRSTSLTDQRQLDIVTEVLNERPPKKVFNKTVYERLAKAKLLPDFKDENSREEAPTVTQAHFNTLSAFEYSSDGFVKRYPEEAKYADAIAWLRKKLGVI